MASKSFDFLSDRDKFGKKIEEALEQGDHDPIQELWNSLEYGDTEKKCALDQAFRDSLYKHIAISAECDVYTKLVTLSTSSTTKELCSASTPFQMLSDLLDSMTLDNCGDIFAYIEARVDMWKSETFHQAGKNYLLRMCNDLLRRLSKSQNPLFSGRIQLFLARLFPIDEKSALNLASQFNLENVTAYNTSKEAYEILRKQSTDEREEITDMEEGEMKESMGGFVIDYNLYKKFWALQDFFRKPNQCYDKAPWKAFTNYITEVLNCFGSYQLDDMKSSRRKLKYPSPTETHTYFAKYLTSEKLLDLQLSDSNFRRFLLVQLLIQFQYLNMQTKNKNQNQVLSEEQTSWVKNCIETVYNLLKETPPGGEKFAKSIEHILSREENWNAWKNDGCPSFIREPQDAKKSEVGGIRRKRSLGDDLKTSRGKIIKMGNSEITRLWNLCQDNMEACQIASNKCVLPTLEEYFEDAVEQADPEQLVEAEYKLVNNPTWAWKALRLLARKSPYFFSQNYSGKKLPEYLEYHMLKLAGDKQQESAPVAASTSSSSANNAESERVNTEMEGEEEEMMREEQNSQPEPSQAEEDPSIKTDQLEAVAALLKEDWKKLATELSFPEEDIEYWGGEGSDDQIHSLKMLTIWKENEGEKATPMALGSALKEIGLMSIAIDALGLSDDAL